MEGAFLFGFEAWLVMVSSPLRCYYVFTKKSLILQLVIPATWHKTTFLSLGQSTASLVLVKHLLSLSLCRCSYLARGISCVPQGIPQVLARPCGRVHDFHRKARVSLSPRGVDVPVGLGDLLPHHNVEAAARLVAEHKSGIVIIPFSVDKEGATEVHSIKLIITWKTRPDPG